MIKLFSLPADVIKVCCVGILALAGMAIAVSPAGAQNSTTPPIALPYTMSTVAGNGTSGSSGNGGPAASAQISNDLRAVAVDGQGNIYIADSGNNEIRKVNSQTGVITLIAGGAAEGACTTGIDKSGDGCPGALANSTANTYLKSPRGLALDKAGDVYIAGYDDDLVHVIYNGGRQASALITLENPSVTSPQIGYMYLIAGELNGASSSCPAYQCAAGTGGYSGDGGLATSAALNQPRGMNVDDNGNLWICDTSNNVVRQVNATTGIITTVVGNAGNAGSSGYAGDGDQANSTSVLLHEPTDVVFDSSNNAYIADFDNKVIREVVASTGVIETIIGGTNNSAVTASTTAPSWPAAAATTGLGSPTKIAIDTFGNLYFDDSGESVVYFYDATAQTITPIAGEYGYAGTASSSFPVCAGASDTVGDGCPATQALFDQGSSALAVAIDGLNNLYITDPADERIRKVSTDLNFAATANGQSTTQTIEIHFTKNDSAAATNGIVVGTSLGDFSAPASPSCTANSDSTTNCTLQVAFSPLGPGMRNAPLAVTGVLTHRNFPLTGVGQAALTGVDPGTVGTLGSGGLSNPQGEALDAAGNIYIADTQNNRVVEISAQNASQQTVIAGTGTAGNSGNGGLATLAELSAPSAVAVGPAGYIFIADTGNNVVRVIDPASGNISVFAGGATTVCAAAGDTQGDVCPATQATLSAPSGLAVDILGNVYIADTGDNLIRRVDHATGYINLDAGGASTVCSMASDTWGDGCPAIAATLNAPHGLALDSSDNLYVADTRNNEARQINLGTGAISAVAGNGVATYAGDNGAATSASLNAPQALAVDAAGDIYIADTGNAAVRVVSASTLNISTLFGTGGLPGSAGGSGPATQLSLTSPGGIALDALGDVYVSDSANNRALVDDRDYAVLAFGNSNENQQTPELTANVSDLGNFTLTFSDSPAYSPTSVTGFTISTSAANACQGNGTLAAGAGCTLGATFEPTATTGYSGGLTFPSNAVNSATASLQLSGFGVNLVSTSVTLALTSPASGNLQYGEAGTITATVAPAGSYSGSATPTGNIIFSIDGTPQPQVGLTSGSATLTINLAVGNHTIVAEYSGDSTFAPSNNTLGVTVSPAATTTTLTASPTTVIQLQNVAFTATVTSATSGTPTGAVNFYSGSTLLGSANLGSNGQAVFNDSSLAVGSYSVTATYAGNGNYSTSTSSPAVAVTVNPIPPDFSVSASSNTLSVPQGGNVQTLLTLTPQGGINGTVTLSCTGLPANATCTFYPTTVALNGTNATAQTELTIYTNTTPLVQQSQLNAPAAPGDAPRTLLALALLPCLLCGFGGLRSFRRRYWGRLLMLVAAASLLTGLLGLSGCNSNATQQAAGITPAGTSTVNVVLSGPNSVTQTLPITLVVVANSSTTP
jgi:sugar lactone lactonase YvrE